MLILPGRNMSGEHEAGRTPPEIAPVEDYRSVRPRHSPWSGPSQAALMRSLIRRSGAPQGMTGLRALWGVFGVAEQDPRCTNIRR